MSNLWARVRAVFTAAPTYLVAASAVAQIVAEEIPGGVVAQTCARIVAVLAAAIAIVRRVTPVLPADRGLLPKDS